MSNSSLANYTRLSPNYGSRDGEKISKITIHHMAGNLSVEGCGEVFSKASRQASSHYGVGTDGRIGRYVDESNRSWASSNKPNDKQSVTIEIANDEYGGNWHVSDKAIQSTIKLMIDICKRNGIHELKFTGNALGNLTLHRMFAATLCPGPYVESKIPYIVKSVNEGLKPAAPAPTNGYIVEIIRDEIYILKGPSNKSGINGTVKKGELYTIVGEENGYGKLKSGAGWIWLGYTKNTKFKPYQVKIVNKAIYVVATPSSKGKIVETIKHNEIYTIIEEENGFGKLKSGAGWIYLGYTARM